MDDAGRMRSVERVRNLLGVIKKQINFQRLAAQPMLQSRAVQKLHHDERLPVLLADIVNGANIRMI